jgi:arginyl-tRNA synthetase
MKRELEAAIAEATKDLFATNVVVELTRPDEKFGDYATNVALQLAQKLGKKPREVAEDLIKKLKANEIFIKLVANMSIAGPGFINFSLNNAALQAVAQVRPAETLKNKVIVAEYSDPNPFKVLHAGHLYTSVIGDAIANLLERAGGKVHRVNFGGDVGLHVAKTMWAIIRELGGEQPDKLNEITEDQRPDWLSARYVEGNAAYEDGTAKDEIVEINKKIYKLFADNDHDSDFAKIYWTCRQWSYDYFDEFYARIGTKFEKYYPESETAPLGLQTVKEHVGKVYEESDGAIIFDGEKYGLHARVFVNSTGLPTYEAKDVGLIMKKWQDYHFDQSVVITGNDIIEYMKVVLKSIEQFQPELAQRSRHLTHGIVKLQGGAKMSSREGNILRAVDVLNAAAEANKKLSQQENPEVVLAAVKYAFLKNRIGGDIIYDPAESVSLEGNSGPYLQYAHARAKSILKKAESGTQALETKDLGAGERSLLRKISEYPEVVDQAVTELMPHHICTYLYELAQTFNRFYENNHVIGDDRQSLRLALVEHYAETLENGLELLGISAPDKM